MMNQREIALEILYKTIKDESYSNLLMRNKLNELQPIQRAFVTNLVNGVLRKYEILQFQLQDILKGNTSLKNRLILLMAIYEKYYLNQKNYVVNNEYVNLAKNQHDKAFINAILHKIQEFKTTDIDHINACLPEWLYNLLKAQYNDINLKKIIDIYQNIPTVYYRLNKAKAHYDDLKHLNIHIINEDIFVCDDNLINSDEYNQGLFYIQDYNSASLYKNLDLNKDMTLLDVCSAPGSKLFNCLDIIKPENAFGNDINEKRVNLIKKMAEKLGYEGINYLNYDGRDIKNHIEIQFDRILLDAPCSGLGVIGRKPDLKFHIEPNNLDELQDIQSQLLKSMDPLLKKEGILLYSTCTLNVKENNKQIQHFLKEYDNYQLLKEETIINDLGDCFYYAKLKKV